MKFILTERTYFKKDLKVKKVERTYFNNWSEVGEKISITKIRNEASRSYDDFLIDRDFEKSLEEYYKEKTGRWMTCFDFEGVMYDFIEVESI